MFWRKNYEKVVQKSRRKFVECEKVPRIFGNQKNCGKKLLKLSESRGIAKKNYYENSTEFLKIVEGHCQNFKEGWKI